MKGNVESDGGVLKKKQLNGYPNQLIDAVPSAGGCNCHHSSEQKNSNGISANSSK